MPTDAASSAPAAVAVVPESETDVAVIPAAEEQAAGASRRSRRAASLPQPPVVAPEPVEDFVLIEPAVQEQPVETLEVVEEASAEHSAGEPHYPLVDAFEAAARLFSFTGETPIQAEAPIDETPEHPAAHVAPRRNRGASFKRVTAASFSVCVMGIVGLMAVGMTTPASAVTAPGGTDITTSVLAAAGGDVEPTAGEIQAYVTPAELQSAPIERAENYSTLTMAQLAANSGIANFSNFFVNDPNSPIQWPFAVGVPISYGFGMRDGTMHEGADFTPGEGAPIQAVADGVVRESTDSGGAFGVHIVIDHVIDGVLVSSSYSHMLYGSRTVEVGDHVTVGTVIGHTGNTGRSFGAHTHFEILANGTTPIDPIPWLREHAGG
jgi:murein DD-endopeptidase MepM/ murein hydrolase activator NlpD